MATPRRRWAKVADKILREELTVYGRSTFLGLLAWFNQRRSRDGYTGRDSQRASIPPGDLLTITLAETLDEARNLIAEITPRFELRVEARGRFTVIEWPKLAEFQEWECPSSARELPVKRPRTSLSEAEAEAEAERKKGARAKSRGRKRPPRTPDLFTRASVEALEPAYFEQLIADRPDLSEAVRTAAHARAWLLAVVPRMDAAGRYTDLRRTARSWFQNARQAEIVEAFDRAAKIAIRTAAASDAARARADPAPEVSAEANAAVRRFMAQATRRMEKPT